MDMGVPPEQERAFDDYCRGIREKAQEAEMERLKKENEDLRNLLKDVPTIQIMQKQLTDMGGGLCRAFKEIDELKQQIFKLTYPQQTFSDEPPTAFRAQRQVIV